jgi:hypothetical protein
MWPAAGCGDGGSAEGAAALRLNVWGGDDPTVEEPDDAPPLAHDLWCFERGAWRTAQPGGGGGAVPPPRTEASLAPLPGGRALLLGGFTDRMGHTPDLSTYIPGTPLVIQGSRLLNDAYLFDAKRRGWRALRCAGEPPPPGASRNVAYHGASKALLAFGGWGDGAARGSSTHFSPTDVFVLRLDADDEEQRCMGCSRTAAAAVAAGGKLRQCGRCHDALFCSAECQRAAWPQHRTSCLPR